MKKVPLSEGERRKTANFSVAKIETPKLSGMSQTAERNLKLFKEPKIKMCQENKINFSWQTSSLKSLEKESLSK